MRKILFITAALLFIWSCNKDDASESFVDQESKNEFFIIQPDNEHVKLMYEYLKNTPEQFDALQGKLLGTPHWSREVSYTSNGKPMYVIPLADFKNKEVNAILLLCAETETLKYRLFINDEDTYPTKGFDWVFEYFKQELFQINGKYKFEDTCSQKKDGVNTKATMEICNDIWAGNDTVGWTYKGNIVGV